MSHPRNSVWHGRIGMESGIDWKLWSVHCLCLPSPSRVGLNMLYADNEGKKRKIANVRWVRWWGGENTPASLACSRLPDSRVPEIEKAWTRRGKKKQEESFSRHRPLFPDHAPTRHPYHLRACNRLRPPTTVAQPSSRSRKQRHK